MFGIGPQELLIIGLLILVVFGPGKAASVARDFGRFVSGAQRSAEEFKSELLSEEIEETKRAVEEFRDEARHYVEEFKAEVPVGEEKDKPSSDPPPVNEEETRGPKSEGRHL